jgi:GAF domain-containing protein
LQVEGRMTKIFEIPLIPANDASRLATLESYQILDSQPEAPFNYIAALAAKRFDAPVALISLVDKYRVWYKASIGLGDIREVPRQDSLCSFVILQDAVTVFSDALKEPCLLANPFVASDFGLRFYAGAPIRTYDGIRLGAVCVIDQKPRDFGKEEQKALEELAAMAMEEIKQRLCP